MAPRVRLSTMCLLLGVAVVSSLLTAPVVTTTLAFEAAFQGKCEDKNPCEQLCYDLHDGTFECGCRLGAVLAKDGYSCFVPMTATDQSHASMSISPDNSISYSDGADSFGNDFGDKFLVTDDDEDDDDDETVEEDELFESIVVDGRKVGRLQSLSRTRDHHPAPVVSNSHPNEVTSEHYNHRLSSNFKRLKNKPQVPSTMQPSNIPQEFGENRPCDIHACEAGGHCIETNEGKAHCLCPVGHGGEHCQHAIEVHFPRFSGHSYLTFPALKNAHRNTQITLEFQPETLDALLLYSGEDPDVEGDFMAVVLIDGFVEFRFDCGSGTGIVRSTEPVILESWNRLVIYRHRWDAWVQLNSGLHSQGRAKGLLSKISFREELYVGGLGNATSMIQRVGIEDHYVGCIRYLEINEFIYDFRPSPQGHVVEGIDIVECNADVCSHIYCQNGGTCSSTIGDVAVCLCPLGHIGPACEFSIDLAMPHFNGTSYLKYPGLGNSALSFIEMSLVIKPMASDGVFFYNGYKIDGTGDFLMLCMSRGHVEFRFDLGTGPAILRSHEPVALYEWHTVFISRTGRDGILEVDRQVVVEGMAEGAFTQLSLPQNLYLGGVPNFDEVSHKIGQRKNFRGCIQQMTVYNRPIRILEAALSGVNVGNCNHPCIDHPCLNQGTCVPHHDRFSCHCQLGFSDARCETEVLESISIPMFVGNSYLKFTQEDIIKRIVGNHIQIDLKLKVAAADGLILWTGEREMTSSSDYLALGLKAGYVHLHYNLGSGEAFAMTNHTRIDDGLWHRIKIIRNEREGLLFVDSSPVATALSPGSLKQLNTNNGLYLGGMEDILHLSSNKYSSGLVGCVSELQLSSDYWVQFVSHASSGMNIEVCV